MILGHMIAVDEAALMCDFAETYQIFDYRALRARQAAVFAAGLGAGSRIMQKLSGVCVSPETLLLAMIADTVRILAWQNTEDGHQGRHMPVSVAEALLKGRAAEKPGFDSPEDFNAWRAGMLGGD